ncbi:MAG: helix-turn-helix domain-containing protein [Bacteroidetes bacterium]|nr:helix-turn-helix domain-containing protein [Bacteroidota bacterium]
MNLNETKKWQLILAEKEYLTSREAAFYLGVSIHTIYKLTATKVITVYKPTGGKIYFKKEGLIDFIETGKRKSIDKMVKKRFF